MRWTPSTSLKRIARLVPPCSLRSGSTEPQNPPSLRTERLRCQLARPQTPQLRPPPRLARRRSRRSLRRHRRALSPRTPNFSLPRLRPALFDSLLGFLPIAQCHPACLEHRTSFRCRCIPTPSAGVRITLVPGKVPVRDYDAKRGGRGEGRLVVRRPQGEGEEAVVAAQVAAAGGRACVASCLHWRRSRRWRHDGREEACVVVGQGCRRSCGELGIPVYQRAAPGDLFVRAFSISAD